MERIKNEMLYKEEDAMADRLRETDLTVEGSVIKMFDLTRTKYVNGQYVIEYLYQCDKCDNTHWSDSKRLYMSCPRCRNKKVYSKMRLAV